MPKAEGELRQRRLLRDFGKPPLYASFHLFAVNSGIVEQKGQMVEAFLQIHQYGQHNDPHRHFSRALFFKVNTCASALHINGQKTIELLPMAFIAPNLGLGVFLGPSVMRVRRALQSEFIQGNQCGVFTGLCRFFLSRRSVGLFLCVGRAIVTVRFL